MRLAHFACKPFGSFLSIHVLTTSAPLSMSLVQPSLKVAQTSSPSVYASRVVCGRSKQQHVGQNKLVTSCCFGKIVEGSTIVGDHTIGTHSNPGSMLRQPPTESATTQCPRQWVSDAYPDDFARRCCALGQHFLLRDRVLAPSPDALVEENMNVVVNCWRGANRVTAAANRSGHQYAANDGLYACVRYSTATKVTMRREANVSPFKSVLLAKRHLLFRVYFGKHAQNLLGLPCVGIKIARSPPQREGAGNRLQQKILDSPTLLLSRPSCLAVKGQESGLFLVLFEHAAKGRPALERHTSWPRGGPQSVSGQYRPWMMSPTGIKSLEASPPADAGEPVWASPGLGFFAGEFLK